METPEERRDRERKEYEEHRRQMRRRRPFGGNVVGPLFLGVVMATILAGMAGAYRNVRLKATRAVLPDTLAGLRLAEISYEGTWGRYLSEGDPGEAYDALALGTPYVPGRDLGFDEAGIAGSYWIVATEKGFEAHGILDADGDGVPAHWVATEAQPPAPITGDGIY